MLQANSYLRLRLRHVCAYVCAYVCVTFALTFALTFAITFALTFALTSGQDAPILSASYQPTNQASASQLPLPLPLPLQANLHHTFANEAKLQPHTKLKPLQEKT